MSGDTMQPIDRIMAQADNGGREALRFLRVYLKNAIQFPNHPSFSTINPKNPTFHKKIGKVDGAVEFLLGCGFKYDAEGMLVMVEKDPTNINGALHRLIDSLSQLESTINQVAPGNLYLFIHQFKLVESAMSRGSPLKAEDVVYMHLRCDVVGAPLCDAIEIHKTGCHQASETKWNDKIELKGKIGVCVHMTLYKKRRFIPDLAVGFAMFSFPGGQDDPVRAWVPVTTEVSNRGKQLGTVKIEVDSESLKMWRAEREDRLVDRKYHKETKDVLMAEGRMPEAPDLASAGVAEAGYVAPKDEHRKVELQNESGMPSAYQHKAPSGIDGGLTEEKLAEAEEKKTAEEGVLAAETQKAEEERLAAEAQKAEEERLAAEAQKAEEERLAAEAQKAEEERLAAEAQKAEEERLAAEAQKAEEAEEENTTEKANEEGCKEKHVDPDRAADDQ